MSDNRNPIDSESVVICQRCGGIGLVFDRVPIGERTAPNHPRSYRSVVVECGDCLGTGRMILSVRLRAYVKARASE